MTGKALVPTRPALAHKGLDEEYILYFCCLFRIFCLVKRLIKLMEKLTKQPIKYFLSTTQRVIMMVTMFLNIFPYPRLFSCRTKFFLLLFHKHRLSFICLFIFNVASGGLDLTHVCNVVINVTGGRFDRTGPLACLCPFPV